MASSLPGWIPPATWALAVAVLAVAARPALAEWRRRAGDGTTHVLVLGALALAAMRWFNTAPLHGVMLHFLGGTIATLLFGAAAACWVMALVSVAGMLLGASWYGWAADVLVTGMLPVAVSVAASWIAKTWVPRNIFTYVMCNAFGAAALAMAASMLAKSAVEALLGHHAYAAYLAATPLLMFGEAFFAGTTMALVVVYRPQWCRGFDDREYLWPQRRM